VEVGEHEKTIQITPTHLTLLCLPFHHNWKGMILKLHLLDIHEVWWWTPSPLDLVVVGSIILLSLLQGNNNKVAATYVQAHKSHVARPSANGFGHMGLPLSIFGTCPFTIKSPSESHLQQFAVCKLNKGSTAQNGHLLLAPHRASRSGI
jgi:hypothetical protein